MDRQNENGMSKITKILSLVVCILAVILGITIWIAVKMNQPDVTNPSDTTGADATGSVPSQSVIPSAGVTDPPATTAPIGLTVTSSTPDGSVVLNSAAVFTGTSDPAASLTVNGSEISRNADGSFIYTAQLAVGKNEFVFVHKQETVTYTLEYRELVESFLPAGDAIYNSGATVTFQVSAKEGSTVKVSFNGQEISLKKAANQVGTGVASGFVLYEGTQKLTDLNTVDLDLGKITYTVTNGGKTETYTSGIIICQKSTEVLSSDPSVTPSGGKYINVGSGYIAEVINYSAETFNGQTRDDYSNPTWNYLPKGTVDYCKPTFVTDTSGRISYALLRSGQRVYVQKSNIPSTQKVKVVDCYKGKLPDHNELGFSSFTQNGRYTVLTLDSMWKAPFYLDIRPQTYRDPSDRDFSVTSCTGQYIEITFCYATVFTGELIIPATNPIFKSVEVIRNTSDTTLRLYLKQAGKFYGWDAYYNDGGQLCFKFLNPSKVSATDNAYGVNLTGVKIMLDVGHGGIDPGASGNGVKEDEANLTLALAIKKELESMGATVILNRETDKALTVDERIQFLEEQEVDFCLAVHHNSIAGHPSVNGFESYYFNAYSARAAQLIYQETAKTDVYQKNKCGWHYYFTCRQTVCPVVLTENGYVSNAGDAANMINPEAVQKKAVATASGIAKYFLENSI